MQADENSWPFNHQEDLTCPICLHEYERKQLTRHHLVPKSRKGRITVLVCAACHKQIHAIFSEKELEAKYSTIEALCDADEFRPFVNWIRKRKPTKRLRVTRSARRRK